MRLAPLLLCLSACAHGAHPPLEPPTTRSPAQLAREAELAQRAGPFLDAYANRGALLTRAGVVVFSSNRTGLPQLYRARADAPQGEAIKVSTPSERVLLDALLPDERTLLFRADTGGDRSFHIYKVDLEGGAHVDLTPGEKLARDAAMVAREVPGLFAYSAHSTKSEATTVYLQQLDGGAPRGVYTNPRGGELAAISPDGAQLLFAEARADQDIVVHEVQVASGSARRIYPPESAPAIVPVCAYSARGERILLATQAEGRPSELLAFDRHGGAQVARYEESILPLGLLVGLAVSPAGDRLAILINGGDHTELRILEAQSLKLERTVELAPGAASLGDYSADGASFTLNQSLPGEPPDVYLVQAASGAVTRLRQEGRPGLSAMAALETSLQTVRAFDGLSIPLNVYLPAERQAKLPAIVLIHGGPSGSAFLRWDPDIRFFTSLGYAVVEPNIRGSLGFGVAYERADNKEKRGDALNDVGQVNAWVRAQPWADAERVIIMGTSYGGYMTLLALSRQPELWRAGVELSGMSNLITMEQLEDQAIRVFDETEFGVLGKEDELLRAWSPLSDAHRITAPVFVYQGVNDPVTPQYEAEQIVAALRARRVPVEYMLIANEGHGIVRRENRIELLSRAARFLEEQAGPR